MANYHVSKNKNLGKWRVTREKSERASDLVNTQEEAERMAKQYSANSGGGEVRIHRPNGKIRDSDTVAPGNDPKSIKDTKH